MSAASQTPSPVVVPQQARWHGRLAARLIWLLLTVLGATLRFRWRDDSGLVLQPAGAPVIFCLWHNRLALAPASQREIRRHRPSLRVAALVSASRDGGLLARVLELVDMEPVRGSSSRRGAQAVRELAAAAGRGLDLAITPDGPRGPCYSVQDGIIALAQLTGRPIVPVSYQLSWKQSLRSWDRFQVPLPFSRCDVVFGPPLRVPREATDAEKEQLRQELEQRMKVMTRD